MPAPTVEDTSMASLPLPALKLHHFSIAVRDLDESIRWYEAIFGLRPGVSKKPAFAAFIRDPDGTLIELLDPGQHD
jgi:catechol 2,3-dioxygenase-like lactoylglutathione lyase family enzyme